MSRLIGGGYLTVLDPHTTQARWAKPDPEVPNFPERGISRIEDLNTTDAREGVSRTLTITTYDNCSQVYERVSGRTPRVNFRNHCWLVDDIRPRHMQLEDIRGPVGESAYVESEVRLVAYVDRPKPETPINHARGPLARASEGR